MRSLIVVIILLVSCISVSAQDKPSPSVSENGATTNFLQRQWYTERGVELPRRFGVGLNMVYMERDISISDVTVKVGNLPPESISDRFDFDVRNRTLLSMVRLDAWVLPFLNLYAMLGQTRTDTKLSTSFELSPPIGSPIPVKIESDQDVKGPLLGGGATLVYGGKAWFSMVDANYSFSDLEAFDGAISALFASGRIGWHRTAERRQYRAWIGIAYLDAKRTLTITTDLPVFGPTKVEVDQEPANPVTYQFGGSLSLNRRWDLLLELGSNFDDAFLTIVSGSYRF